jgi:hypothetical protein
MLLQDKLSYYVIRCGTFVFWSKVCYLLDDGFLLGLLFENKYEDDMFLRNVGWYQRTTHQPTNQKTNWVLQEPPVAQLLKNFPSIFPESVGSLPCSHQPATGPYPELD